MENGRFTLVNFFFLAVAYTVGALYCIKKYNFSCCYFVHIFYVVFTYNLPRKAAEVGSSVLSHHIPTSTCSPSVTAFNSSRVFKPVGLIIQGDGQWIIWSKNAATALVSPSWQRSLTSRKRSRVSWEIIDLCMEVLPPLSVNLHPFNLFQTASGNVEAKVVCFYRRRDISHSLIQLADKHASE